MTILWQRGRRGASTPPPKYAFCAYCCLRGQEEVDIFEDCKGNWAHRECVDDPAPDPPRIDEPDNKPRGIYEKWPQ